MKQERRKLARGRRDVRAQARQRDHRRRTGRSSTSATSRPTARIIRRPTSRRRSSRRSARRCPRTRCSSIGTRDGRRLCAALDVYTPDTLWGRYWGMTEYVPGPALRGVLLPGDRVLHRARASRRFEGGAQGLHKLARGLRPVATHSLHAVGDRRLRARPSPTSARASASRSRIRSTSSRPSSPVQAGQRARPVAARVRIFYADHFVLPLPPGHRFPMPKYARAARARGAQSRSTACACPSRRATPSSLRVHDAAYVAQCRQRNARRAGHAAHRLSVVRRRWSSVASLGGRDDRRMPQRARVRLRRQSRGRHAPRASRTSAKASASSTTPPSRRARCRPKALRGSRARSSISTSTRATAPPRSSPATTACSRCSMHGRAQLPVPQARSDLDVELDDGTGDAPYLATLARRAAARTRSGAARPRDLSRRRRPVRRRSPRQARAVEGAGLRRATATCSTRCASTASRSRSPWPAAMPTISTTSSTSTSRRFVALALWGSMPYASLAESS